MWCCLIIIAFLFQHFLRAWIYLQASYQTNCSLMYSKLTSLILISAICKMFFNAPHLISSEEICLIGLRKVAEVHVWLTSVWGIASSCIFDNFISHLASLLKAKYVKKVWNQSNRCMAIMLHAFLVNISFVFDKSEGQHNGWIVCLSVSLRFFNF